ncbi:TetR/AcrR family transcriptional regulator [Nocardiopsis aegyptia]|uniref:TetR/AcrR family transcriptional regulator n=1 Tax=Nocardiopsis aegyptia TaxID=220378 RepID=UPI003670FBE8
MRTVNPEQHARRRAAILAAAAQEFAEKGVDGTSTASICRRAGIGSGTLFHYFPTKREIFHALFADDLAESGHARARALAADDPREGLDALVGDLVADADDPLVPGLMAAALFEVNRDEEFARLLQADEDRTVEALTELLRALADQGRPPVFPPERSARWIQHLVDAVFFGAGDEDFDADRARAELRVVVAWLVDGGEPGGGESGGAEAGGDPAP